MPRNKVMYVGMLSSLAVTPNSEFNGFRRSLKPVRMPTPSGNTLFSSSPGRAILPVGVLSARKE
eukprot:3864526-Amphidinium_carterae.1